MIPANVFIYGLQFRPPSIGAVPSHGYKWIEHEDVPRDIKQKWDKRQYRHGLLLFKQELSEREIKSYELVDMNTDPIESKWEDFVEWATDLVDYEIEYNQFVADFIHPRGEMREANPLHEMAPMDFFKLLAKKGYPGKMKGLEKFYNRL